MTLASGKGQKKRHGQTTFTHVTVSGTKQDIQAERCQKKRRFSTKVPDVVTSRTEDFHLPYRER
jgi:hypothetical protein